MNYNYENKTTLLFYIFLFWDCKNKGKCQKNGSPALDDCLPLFSESGSI